MTALMLAVPLLAGCVNTAAPQDLTAAAVNDAPANGRVREFHVYVGSTILQPYEDRSVITFGFSLSPDGPFTVPAPELRVTQGDTIKAWLHDNSGLGHTIHWHGLKLPWAMDGVPYVTQTISKPGEPGVYLYEFVARESGTYWYHCHVDAPSHVDFGLFGALIIEPADPAQDPPFDREHTLILHEIDSQMFTPFDATANPDELKNYPRNPFDLAEALQNSGRTAVDLVPLNVDGTTGGATDVSSVAGSQGPRDYYGDASLRYRPKYDTFMLNGKSYPDTEPVYIASGETIRIRLIHAGQLLHTMHLHGTHFLVTHKDGYKLASPYYADSIVIGPGERYDIYVEGDNPGMWDFHDHGGAWGVGGYTSNNYAFPGGMTTMLVYEDFTHADLPGPEPEGGWTSGHYAAFAPIYPGVTPPDRMVRHGH